MQQLCQVITLQGPQQGPTLQNIEICFTLQ